MPLSFGNAGTLRTVRPSSEPIGTTVLEVERPIVEVGRGRVVLNRDWLKATKGMYAQIPTPLPTNATQLNLCLMVLCKLDWDQLKGGTGQVVYGSRLRITKLLGLNSHERNAPNWQGLGRATGVVRSARRAVFTMHDDKAGASESNTTYLVSDVSNRCRAAAKWAPMMRRIRLQRSSEMHACLIALRLTNCSVDD